ncbi:hypothetical protein [Rossellomorea aquimaris]|uniref:hypothetical protein n=1 Tax=Rossellomorea aquimaris TaxID=189382 RepID=UPI0007D04769|nr:hypothetical protein [Rossellomorea aquimaris]
MENLHLCPIPYLILDRKFTVMEASNSGYSFIKDGENFLSIIEEESAPKFSRMIHKNSTGEMELNIKQNSTFELVELFYQFSEMQQAYHVAIISKDTQYNKVSEQMNGLFDLMGKSTFPRKEPNLTDVLAQVSSLYLKLSNTSDWNRQEVMNKIKEIENQLQKNVK